MDETSARTLLTPVRLLGGVLAATGGILLLGAIFGSPSASADESDSNSSLLGGVSSTLGAVDSTVSSVVNAVGDTVDAVTAPVVQAAPPPVRDVVQPVAPVTDAVGDVAQSGLVGQVVAPVAETVDSVVAQVPVVSGLLGHNPVSSITTPVTGTVDDTVSGTVGTVTGVVSGIADRVGVGPTEPPATGADDPSAASVAPWLVPNSDAPGDVADAVTQTFARTTISESRGHSSVAADMASALGSSPGDPTGAPDPGGPDASPPANGVGGSSGGAGGAGAPGAVADAGYTSVFPPVAAGSSSRSGGDALPSSPAGDHDVSPD
jgi:hypothetical protein